MLPTVGFELKCPLGWLGVAVRTVEQLHDIRYNFSGVPLLALLVFPRTGLDLSFDVHLRSFAQVLFGSFGHAAPNDDVVPPVWVVLRNCGPCRFPRLPLGMSKRPHRRGVAHFRVFAQIAHEDCFVDSCHASKVANAMLPLSQLQTGFFKMVPKSVNRPRTGFDSASFHVSHCPSEGVSSEAMCQG